MFRQWCTLCVANHSKTMQRESVWCLSDSLIITADEIGGKTSLCTLCCICQRLFWVQLPPRKQDRLWMWNLHIGRMLTLWCDGLKSWNCSLSWLALVFAWLLEITRRVMWWHIIPMTSSSHSVSRSSIAHCPQRQQAGLSGFGVWSHLRMPINKEWNERG